MGQVGAGPHGFPYPHRAGSGVHSLHWTFKEPPIQERMSLGPGDQASRGENQIHQPQLHGLLPENEFPGRGPQEPQANSSGFHGAICGAGDRELSTGRPCPLPAHLAGLPHQETHVSMSAPQKPTGGPLSSQGPGHYRPLLAPGPSCTLYSVGCHSTARERS